VLAIALISNAVMPVRMPTGQMFAHKCAVFALEDFASPAVLSSSAHTVWTIRYTSTMRTDINYSPSEVFDDDVLPGRRGAAGGTWARAGPGAGHVGARQP
jgi:hypothetical protein